jgi:hypothetical protein
LIQIKQSFNRAVTVGVLSATVRVPSVEENGERAA